MADHYAAMENPLVTEAKAFFENQIAEGATKGTLVQSGGWAPGEVTPRWEEAYLKADEDFVYVYVPIHAENSFFAREKAVKESTVKRYRVAVTQLLLFRKGAGDYMDAHYLTLIPSKGHYTANKNQVGERFIKNEGFYGNFSGRVIYNRLVTFHTVAVDKVIDGEFDWGYSVWTVPSEESFLRNHRKMFKNVTLHKRSGTKAGGLDDDEEKDDYDPYWNDRDDDDDITVSDSDDDDIAYEVEYPPIVVPGGGGGSGGGGGTGGGTGIGGGSGSNGGNMGGGNGNQSGKTVTPSRITLSAQNAVNEMITIYGMEQACCNISVKYVLKELFGSTEFGDKRASQMVEQMQTSSNWEQVSINEAQNLANQGHLVVAGWQNPNPNSSGHVMVVVPGSMVYDRRWDCMVPMVMDTGSSTRSSCQPLSGNMGSSKKNSTYFFKYK